MSVRHEAQPGDEIVCIQEFESRGSDPDLWRTFRIDERVRYVGSFFKETPEDNPTGYMVEFERFGSMTRYSAVEAYFVTADHWEDLKNYFYVRFSVG